MFTPQVNKSQTQIRTAFRRVTDSDSDSPNTDWDTIFGVNSQAYIWHMKYYTKLCPGIKSRGCGHAYVYIYVCVYIHTCIYTQHGPRVDSQECAFVYTCICIYAHIWLASSCNRRSGLLQHANWLVALRGLLQHANWLVALRGLLQQANWRVALRGMYTYAYISTCICMHLHSHIHMKYIHNHIYMYTYTIRIHIHTYTHTYHLMSCCHRRPCSSWGFSRLYTHTYVYTYIRIHIQYVYTYIRIHIHMT
jgi:hypothetical protein